MDSGHETSWQMEKSRWNIDGPIQSSRSIQWTGRILHEIQNVRVSMCRLYLVSSYLRVRGLHLRTFDTQNIRIVFIVLDC